MNELALFAGAGGGILGGTLLGWRTVCAVEIEDYPRRVLLQRQADGILPRFPVWDDVNTFDGKPWRGKVDVISGGFPCQDISVAGLGAGIAGLRSGLWKHFARIIGEVQPHYVFIENSPNLRNKGLEVVLEDLWRLGYDARWGVVGAHHAGAPHKRNRIWIVAHSVSDSQRSTHRRAGGISFAGWYEHSLSGRDSFRGNLGDSSSKLNEEVRYSTGKGFQDGAGEQVGQLGSVAQSQRPDSEMAHANGQRGRGGDSQWQDAEDAGQRPESSGNNAAGVGWWATELGLGRVAHGVAHRVDRLKAIGNGQVPSVAAIAWEVLKSFP
jgi:DNA (cytosine-5)-methyltransferase 1